MKIVEILKYSNYKINQSIFSDDLIQDLENSIYEKQTKKGKAFYTKCVIRDKEIQLKPEEVIRQLYLRKLIKEYEYPKERIKLEYPIYFGREKKRADIVITERIRPDTPYIIVEVKKPKLKEGKQQLKSYTNATGAPIAVWTNGERIEYFHRKDPNYFENIPDIPKAYQSLKDLLKQKFTIEDLKKVDKLVNEKVSLKDIIIDLEDEILANAGVDVFEEVFKLILTKLYDELQSVRDKDRNLEFRNYGETDAELKEKIQSLFDQAKRKWQGIFPEDSKIELSPSHLSICVSSLQDIKIFNTNLDVIDDAFEYLVNKTSKGEKGQYFTPRYVIDMAVKMINPTEKETIIDPACGSFGFPIHAVFKVWKDIYEELGISEKELLTAEEKHPRAKDYVSEKVFGIDFDEKVVRVAKLLNLIAGDGHSNVIRLNSLDWELWEEWINDEDWQDKYFDGWRKLKRFAKRRGDFSEFNFDIVLTNPPFAGEIKESRIIHKYDIAQAKNGKYPSKISRDILFIERALKMLKPGGRMAIVLPQGRLNNATDKYIREFISEHARILAVVGLHQNVFKPHTGTKTSVLFVQKWDDEINLKLEDYPIFFATMQEPSKDNSGEKIFVKYKDFLKWEEEGKIPPLPEEFKKKALENPEERVLDKYGHLIVKHDLYSVETEFEGVRTPEGIAEAFLEFAKKEGFSFVKKKLNEEGFDEKRYKRFLDSLEAVELKLSEVKEDNPDLRLDSEFFKKVYLEIDEKIKRNTKYIYFKDCINLLTDYTANGSFASLKRNVKLYTEKKYAKWIRINELDKMDFSNTKYVDKNGYEFLRKTKLFGGELLISKTGEYLGKAYIMPKIDELATLADNIFLIRLKDKFSKEFLKIYINSLIGQSYIKRFSQGVGQPTIIKNSLKNIKIPLFSPSFQSQIETLVKTAYQNLEESKKLYKEAEDILLEELDLKDFKPTKENIAIVSSKEAFLNGRLDAEYYQPKYKQIEDKIKSYKGGWEYLGKIVNIKKSIEPGSKYYQDEGIPFVRVSDISKFEINKPSIYLSPDFLPKEELERLKPQKNTILFSKDGTVGIAYLIHKEWETNIITSNALLHLKIKKAYEKEIYPEVLTLILNSKLVQLQAERDTGGSIIQHWRIDQIKRVLIPKIDPTIQEQIKQKIQKSFQLRENSKKLLEIAKKAVEIAIEQNEEKAVEFIYNEVKNVLSGQL